MEACAALSLEADLAAFTVLLSTGQGGMNKPSGQFNLRFLLSRKRTSSAAASAFKARFKSAAAACTGAQSAHNVLVKKGEAFNRVSCHVARQKPSKC